MSDRLLAKAMVKAYDDTQKLGQAITSVLREYPTAERKILRAMWYALDAREDTK